MAQFCQSRRLELQYCMSSSRNEKSIINYSKSSRDVVKWLDLFVGQWARSDVFAARYINTRSFEGYDDPDIMN
jgi:hypothetical protein